MHSTLQIYYYTSLKIFDKVGYYRSLTHMEISEFWICLLYHHLTQIMNDIFFPQYSSWPYYWWRHEYCITIQLTRRMWKYQRGNHNPYIEEEQTTQCPKEQVQKDTQRSIKHTYKTKDRVTRTPLKTGGKLRWALRL